VDERGDEQVAHVAAHAGALVEALELAQHRRGGAVVAAVGADHEEGGGVGRGDELGEEAGAVLVAPLEVGHAQDQRAAVGDAGEQLLEAAEGPAAGLLLVGALEHALRGVGDELHAGEHGEEAGQLVHVAGHERGGLDLGEAAEVVGEGVDDGVEGLEGDGLALVAAAVEDHGLAAAAQGGEEVVDEGGLADAGAAVHVDGDGGALAGGVVGVVEGGEQVVAADERGGLGAGAAGRATGDRHALGRGGAGEHVGAGEPGGGVALQQAHAQVGEVFGGAGGELVDVEGVVLLLGGEDLEGGADEGEAAGEGLVEHHADGVPVAGGGDDAAGGLLGRHVRGGPEDAVVEGGVDRRDDAVADEAEVEDDDAAAAGDEDVGGLEVAVELAGGVEGV
jgi:hypothetical protein